MERLPVPGVDRLAVVAAPLGCQLVLRLKLGCDDFLFWTLYKPPGCFRVSQSQPQLTSTYQIRYLRGNDSLMKITSFGPLAGVKEMIDRVQQCLAFSWTGKVYKINCFFSHTHIFMLSFVFWGLEVNQYRTAIWKADDLCVKRTYCVQTLEEVHH